MKLLSHPAMGIHIWTKVRKGGHPSWRARFYFTPKAEFPLAVAAGLAPKPDEAR